MQFALRSKIFHFGRKIRDCVMIRSRLNKYLPSILFVISFVIIFITALIKFPSNGIEAEFFAEAGANFFYHARYTPVFKTFLIPEAGYLPLLQRIIAFFVVTIGGAEANAPFIFQVIALAGISFFCSFINLHHFKILIPSNIIRFALGLTLAFFPNFEMFPYINFIYFGFVFLFLLSFYGFRNKSYLTTFLWGLLGLFLIGSKALLLCIAPYFGLLLLMAVYKNKRKDALVYSMLTLGAILQSVFCLYVLIFQSGGVQSSSQKNISQLITMTFDLYLGISVQDFMGYFYLIPSFFFIKIALFLTAFLFIPIYFYRINKKQLAFGLFGLQLTSIISLVLFLGLAPVEYYPKLKIGEFSHPPFFRWYFIAHHSFILTVFIFIGNLRSKIMQLILIALFIYFYPGYRLFQEQEDIYKNKDFSHSQWDSFIPLLKEDAFCIPVNPDPWLIQHNCEVSNSPEERVVLAVKVNMLNSGMKPEKLILEYSDKSRVDAKNILKDTIYYQYWVVEKKEANIKFHFYNLSGKEIFPNKIVYYSFTPKKSY